MEWFKRTLKNARKAATNRGIQFGVLEIVVAALGLILGFRHIVEGNNHEKGQGG